MAKKLGFTPGIIQNTKRAAAILAIKEKDDVIYDFNGIEYIITLVEAKELLPELIAETLQELSNFRIMFNKHFDSLQKELLDIIEVSLRS